MTERRISVCVRIDRPGVRWIDDMVVEIGHPLLDRSAVVRAALAVVQLHEPELVETIREQL